MEIGRISDAEYEIMEVVWKVDGEVTTADIIEGLGEEKTWKHTTILTLARRLVNKNILELRKENRINYYSPKISRDQYKSYQADGFIEDLYNGSVKSLVASLYKNEKIDEGDLKELKDWIRGL